MRDTTTKWYQLGTEEVFKLLGTSENGLNQEEAQIRLEKQGRNELPKEKRFRVWLFLLGQLKSPLVYILVLAGAISLGIGHNFDALIIFAAVGVNIGIGFYQEYSSSKVLEKLSKIVRVLARVKRNKEIKELDSEFLVAGDIISLKPGMKIPADGRLIYIKNLHTNESLLTGESATVKKTIDPINKDVSTGDQKNMVFMGTTVEEGEGIAVITATGKDTEIGKIAMMTKSAAEEETPLQKKIGHLGKVITIIVTLGALIIIVVGLIEKLKFTEIFITSIAVAVAAIPEGLPAAIAVILAVSSRRILAKNGLVKHLISAESLGSTSVICVDKTGTLTEGKMKLENIISKADKNKIMNAIIFANEALLEKNGNTYQTKGDTTDQAKMQYALDNGLNPEKLLEMMPRLNMIPFDSVYKYVASFHKIENGKVGIFVTGAPEILLELCSSIQEDSSVNELTATERNELMADNERRAGQGLRVIGAAYLETEASIDEITKAEEKELQKYITDLIFIGLVEIKDPLREDVKKIMAEVQDAGLRVVMLTGDHKLTAVAIGKELGMRTTPEAVMEGTELDKMSEEELEKRIKDIHIFARVSPSHKLKIASAWKKIGESVAMTGDGINDAPALKVADIGIALNSGTDVTKEAADLVLLDDSFVSIIEAIKQGRTAFDNIRKVTIFLLSDSFTELIIVLGALVLRMPLPITAVQILWTNLVEDGLPNLALAFEPSEKDALKRKPISRKESILDKEATLIAYPSGIFADLVLFGIFLWFLKHTSYDIGYIRTLIFAALGTNSLFLIFGLKSLSKSVLKTNPFNNMYLLIAIGIGFLMMFGAIHLPVLNQVLKTQPLVASHWLLVVGLGLGQMGVIEIIKWWFYRKNQTDLRPGSATQ
ncbi:MAG: HAD-IC family P-type ATPase [bacterium]|nr:HAD-IC family P-type ATPase [bacterium]